MYLSTKLKHIHYGKTTETISFCAFKIPEWELFSE